MKKPWLINGNREIINKDGKVIERPAVAYLPKYEVLMQYGNHEDVANTINQYNMFVCSEDEAPAVCLDLSKIDKDVACYIIARMVSQPLSGFISAFHKSISCDSMFSWIKKEMVIAPIDVRLCNN